MSTQKNADVWADNSAGLQLNLLLLQLLQSLCKLAGLGGNCGCMSYLSICRLLCISQGLFLLVKPKKITPCSEWYP